MIFAIAIQLLQLLLIIHMIKTHQESFWLYLLIFVPGIGGLAYLIVVVLPDLRTSRHTRQVVQKIDQRVRTNRRLKELEQTLAIADTVANRINLADAYMEHGNYTQAVDYYQQCLQGIFKNDRTITTKLLRALFYAAQYEQALALAHRLEGEQKFTSVDDRLLYIRCQEKALGADQAIADAYHRLYKDSRNLEVGHEQVRLCLALGQTEQASAVVTDMENQLRAHKDLRTTMGSGWVKAAKKLLSA
jgi:hypothetical protein